MPRKQSPSDLWGEFELKQNIEWSLENLSVWIRKAHSEIRLAYLHSDAEDQNIPAPAEENWMRWSLQDKPDAIKLTPVFPDRPVVVKPETTFSMVKNASVRIYIRVPIWISVSLAGKKSQHLIDIPSVILSNTWFGSFFEGELCYWISSSARLQVEADPKRPYLAVCPVQLTNNSEEDLEVEKLSLRVQNLSLFFDKEQLWSGQTDVHFRGAGQDSELSVSGKPPLEARSAKLISKPREELTKSLSAKTFASIRDLPGLGIFIK